MLIVTMLSLLMAATMGWLALRLLREEQRRSEARVAALTAALDDPVTPSAMPSIAAPTAPRTAPTTVARGPAPVVADADEPTAASAPVYVALDDTGADDFFGPADPAPPLVTPPPIPHAPETQPGSLADAARLDRPMFGDRPEDTPARDDRRWLAVAAVALVAILGVFGVRWVTADGSAATAGGSASTAVADAGAPAGIPVELVALNHERTRDGLVVRGLVRNPTAGSPLRGTSASVFLFDGEGGFLGSSRAPLDTPTLGAGDEAAFEVRLPGAADVRRYRVTLRNAEGLVVPHVDRR